MTGGNDTTRAPRVVVYCPWEVSPDGNDGQASCKFIAASSAYEAAAELLAEPAHALVVELRLLSPEHLRLLDTARLSGAEVIACGNVPRWVTGEDLSGVRMTSRADLPRTLARLAAQYDWRQASSPARAEAEATVVLSRPEDAADIPPAGDRPKQPEPRVALEPTDGKPSAEPSRPADVLTSDEIAALLEDSR